MRWHEHSGVALRVQLVPAVRRLTLYGDYAVEQRPWTNALPARGLGGDELAALWRKMVLVADGSRERRTRSAVELAAAVASGDAHLAEVIRHARYCGKTELKAFFSIVVCLHRVLAPDAPFVCGENCPHAARGATPEQCKRYLDALDAAIAHTRCYIAECNSSHVMEDYGEELYLYGLWRGAFASLFGSDAPAPPPSPPRHSELWQARLRTEKPEH